MTDLTPIAFDIETSGVDSDAKITVAGVASEAGCWLCLNTGQRLADAARLTTTLQGSVTGSFEIDVQTTESALLTALKKMSEERINPDRQYLTAYNGETWNDGFDLPFLRSACVRHQIDWPFPELAYVDVMTVIDRFNTGDATDLASVYDRLIGAEHCDPFTESESAIKAYETGNWQDLLLHNLADIQRTRELAILAEQYVPKSDFNMKNLAPPNK